MKFSDSAKDFYKIVDYFEDELDVDIDSFTGLQNILDDHLYLLEDINIELFRIRFALQYFDRDAIAFLNSAQQEFDLKHIINEIEPGFFPLMEAVNRNNYEQAEFLLQMGANPNQGNEPWFPLLQADTNRDLRMVKLLEGFGADWDHNIRIYEHWNKEIYKRQNPKYIKKIKA